MPESFSQIVAYYKESRTRGQRRTEILEACLDHFSRHGWESPTMSEIADLLVLERRTLYSYYSNKTDLVVDSLLYGMQYFISDAPVASRQRWEKLRRMDVQERLETVLRQHAEVLFAQHPRDSFVLSYDDFLVNLPTDSAAFQRFLELRRQVATKVDVLGDLLADAYERGEIDCGSTDPHELGQILEQGFRAYVLKIKRRQDYTDHYQPRNLEVFIRVLIRGVVAQPPKTKGRVEATAT